MRSEQKKPSRRRFLKWSLGSVAVASGTLVLIRTTGYPEITGWKSKELSARQAHIIISACQVVIPTVILFDERLQISQNIDRFLHTFPKKLAGQAKLVIDAVEHLTAMDLRCRRFSRLDDKQRDHYLLHLAHENNNLRLLYTTLRELIMSGYYQMPSSWAGTGYTGPLMPSGKREMSSKYRSLVAKKGTVPLTFNEI